MRGDAWLYLVACAGDMGKTRLDHAQTGTRSRFLVSSLKAKLGIAGWLNSIVTENVAIMFITLSGRLWFPVGYSVRLSGIG